MDSCVANICATPCRRPSKCLIILYLRYVYRQQCYFEIFLVLKFLIHFMKHDKSFFPYKTFTSSSNVSCFGISSRNVVILQFLVYFLLYMNISCMYYFICYIYLLYLTFSFANYNSFLCYTFTFLFLT